jgi:spore coat protein U-like protein
MSGARIGGVAWLGAALVVMAAGNASAASATAAFAASAVVLPACTVNANNLNFGTYLPGAAIALAGTTTINVFCTSGTLYSVAANVGSTGGSFSARVLASGPSLLGYNLYTSPAYLTIWGDGTQLTAVVSGIGLGLLTTSATTVYGLIPIAQDLPAGTYSSTITVTVSY